MTAARIQLLLPAQARWPQPLAPGIATAIARADRIDATLAGVPDMPASAALARLGEGDLGLHEVRAHRWLRADPAWIRPDINGARLFAVGAMMPMDAEDMDAFAAAVQALCDESDALLQPLHPQRWYLRLPPDAELPRFATPVEALGEDVFDHRPQGWAARRWRVLDNEVQVMLHQHPRNALRQRQGKPPVNALWWWGGAALPDTLPAIAPTLYSDDPLLRGGARLASMATDALPRDWPGDPAGLYDLRGVRGDALTAGWLQPALQWMAETGGGMDWNVEDGPTWRLARRQRWRLWRRPQAQTAAPESLR